MKASLALVAFEIRERKALLAAAAVASLLPLLAPLLPSTGSNPASDIRETVMWFMVSLLVPLFALLLGATFINRDLAEGRLGFYFAQPLPGPTIWFAKLIAVVVLVWAAQLIMMLPTALSSSGPWRILVAKGLFFEWLGPWISSLTIWIAPVAVILLAHAFGLVWRARSLWIVVDIIAIALLVVASRWVISPFLQIFAAHVVLAVYAWLLISTLIGLVVAGTFQLTFGRVDARRGHRALSGVLWATLAIGVGAAQGWSLWVRSAEPGDLNRVYQVSVGSGDWIAVTGSSRGRLDFHPGFIINTADGRWIPAHSGSNVFDRMVVFSADMSRAVWTSPEGYEEADLISVDLDGDDVEPRQTGVVLKRNQMDMKLSGTGSRVAVIQEGSVLVYDVGSARLLGVANVAGEFSPYVVQFDGEDTLVVLAGRRERVSDDPSRSRTIWKRYRFHVDLRILDEGEVIDTTWRWWTSQPDDDLGFTFEVHEVEGRNRLQLVRHLDGGAVADLGTMPAWSDIRVTSDGLIVVIRDEDQSHHVDVFNSRGELIHRVDLPPALWMAAGGEVSTGLLAVEQSLPGNDDGGAGYRRTVIVKIEDGTTVHEFEGMSLVLTRWRLRALPGSWNVGSVATRLMSGEDGSLHLWDPETNELKQLIPVPD